MNKILIADKLSAEAEKIFLANNIACDIKTGLNENEIIVAGYSDSRGDYFVENKGGKDIFLAFFK